MPPRPELDEPGALVHVVEVEPQDGRVEALGGRLVPHAEDDVVELQDLERGAIGRVGHRVRTSVAAVGWTAFSPRLLERRRPAVPARPGRPGDSQVEGQGDGPGEEQGDVDGHGPPVKPRELEGGEVAGRRRLRADAGRAGLREEHVPRVHRADQGQRDQPHRGPAERCGLPERQDQHERERQRHGGEPEPVVPREDSLHDPRRDRPVDRAERGRRHEEGEEDLDAEARPQEGGRETVEDSHLDAMIRAGVRGCQGAPAGRFSAWCGTRRTP